MKRLMKIFFVALFAVLAVDASAQSVSAMKSRLAVGGNKVTVVEQSDVSESVRQVESRPRRTKVNGYTILLLSDNSSRARENAVEAKEKFEENFPDIEVQMYYQSPSFYVAAGEYLTKEEAIIEMMRFRTIFPKAITQMREMDITDFIISEEESKDE
ncbi:MAG: hypothetical protein J6P90_02210 [Rikenellaceae bacterium]|nr:hypothetical protein [Rikenellaceae bacterium]MBO7342645.1 hypothetical protein [Alistipes sp.]